MPSTIRAGFGGLEDVRRDLDSVRIGLSRQVAQAIKDEAQPLVARTAALTPKGPGPQSLKDKLPHVAETLTAGALARGLGVYSSHPAAPVLEWGGTIRPKGADITIREHAMARDAADELAGEVEARISRRIDELLRTHGL